jgi:hypothetical protein
MVFNATFNSITILSWQSVLLVKETRKKHRTATSHSQTLPHNVVSNTPRHVQDLNSDCTGSCKSNYQTIMSMTAPR